MKVITDHHIYLEILENNINDAVNTLLNEESREVAVCIVAVYIVAVYIAGKMALRRLL